MQRILAVCAVFALFAGCTDKEIVFRDREPFNPPADSASGFLGYYATADQKTSCGNCHVEKQAEWQTSAHSHAWETLTASGHQQSSCNACHTVSEKGNRATGPAGYSKKADSTYHDVQCESCHGPGFEHASNPTLSNVPLARIAVPLEETAWDSSATCASCHSGTHHPFVEQWASSAHAGVIEDVVDEYLTNPAQYTSCMGCHEGRHVLKAWNVRNSYVEQDEPVTDVESAMPITCSVCHDPHANENEGQLRWAINDPSPDANLCMKCHNRTSEPRATTYRGPHAPQGGVLLGTAGWWPPGYDTTSVAATHGNPAVNTRLCAGCHVTQFTVTDKLTGAFTFQSVGHLFSPDPCLDATGQPAADQTCLRPGDAGYVTDSRSFAGCAGSGCHSSVTVAQSAFSAQRNTLKLLADQLWTDADGDQVLVTYGTDKIGSSFDPGDTGLLSQVALTEYNYGDNKISVAEGALYNAQLVGEGLYGNGDGSYGVHNPFLAQALLTASINAMKAQYNLTVSPRVEALLKKVEGEMPRVRITPSLTTTR